MCRCRSRLQMVARRAGLGGTRALLKKVLTVRQPHMNATARLESQTVIALLRREPWTFCVGRRSTKVPTTGIGLQMSAFRERYGIPRGLIVQSLAGCADAQTD